MPKRKIQRQTWGVPIILTIWDRDKGICQLCRTAVDPKDYSIDHIVPLAAGGRDDLSNLQLAHRVCNSEKRANVESDPFARCLVRRTRAAQSKLIEARSKGYLWLARWSAQMNGDWYYYCEDTYRPFIRVAENRSTVDLCLDLNTVPARFCNSGAEEFEATYFREPYWGRGAELQSSSSWLNYVGCKRGYGEEVLQALIALAHNQGRVRPCTEWELVHQ